MHQVVGTQTWVPAADPAVACEPSPAHSGHGPGAPGEHCLKTPMDERTFVEVQASNRELQHIIREKKAKQNKFGHTGEGKRNG